MLSEIAFEQIRDNYWFGSYGPFRVVMDKSNGYINASKLCRTGGKHYHDWSRLKGSHELVSALRNHMMLTLKDEHLTNSNLALQNSSEHICSELSPPCITIQTFNLNDPDRLISGTYCHPLLIPHIASWVSADFAVLVGEIVNHFMVEDWKFKLQLSEQSALQLLLDLQQCQLSLEGVREAGNTSQLALESIKEENNMLESVMGELQDVVQHKNEVIEVKKEVMGGLEENMLDKIRERQLWATTHAFTMLKLNDPNSHLPYYVIRCQGRRMGTAINKLRHKFPSSEVIYQQRKVPNAINLYSRLKKQHVVEHSRNFCLPTCTEKELLIHLNSLCGTHNPASNPTPLNAWSRPTSP